ncbi:MAG: CZB domain-containing protein [bacterium]|nr:CZB domain-containing protein [bacterium]
MNIKQIYLLNSSLLLVPLIQLGFGLWLPQWRQAEFWLVTLVVLAVSAQLQVSFIGPMRRLTRRIYGLAGTSIEQIDQIDLVGLDCKLQSFVAALLDLANRQSQSSQQLRGYAMELEAVAQRQADQSEQGRRALEGLDHIFFEQDDLLAQLLEASEERQEGESQWAEAAQPFRLWGEQLIQALEELAQQPKGLGQAVQETAPQRTAPAVEGVARMASHNRVGGEPADLEAWLRRLKDHGAKAQEAACQLAAGIETQQDWLKQEGLMSRQEQGRLANLRLGLKVQDGSLEDLMGHLEILQLESGRLVDLAQHLDGQAADLNHWSNALREQLSQFRHSNRGLILLELVQQEHLEYRQQLLAFLESAEPTGPTNWPDYRSCRFGRWYYGTGQREFGQWPAFEGLEEPHRQLHRLARELLEAKKRGEIERTSGLLQQWATASEAVMDGIDQMQNQLRLSRS